MVIGKRFPTRLLNCSTGKIHRMPEFYRSVPKPERGKAMNPLLSIDSYKASHYKQYPPDAEGARFYIAPRKPIKENLKEFIVFGISYFVSKYLKTINLSDIEEAKSIFDKFGVGGSSHPFPVEQFKSLVGKRLPITINGIKEGYPLTNYNEPVAIVEILDKNFVWLAGFIETAFHRSVWYGSTVATNSRNIRLYLKHQYQKCVDDDQYWSLDYRLHDFGARGASSAESAALGGLSHLINFNGTDTIEAIKLGVDMYGMKVEDLACSIPASEHSTVTAWGATQTTERLALLNMIEQFGGGALFAFVSDSYDYKSFVDNVWGDPNIIKLIRSKGAVPVVRPDSGDPVEMVLYGLNSLEMSWGVTINGKGFKVLNGIRMIQGDGMDYNSIIVLYDAVIKAGFSPENLAVGMGGGLLQRVNRDDMSWAMKMHEIKIDGKWFNVQKKPKTDMKKAAWANQKFDQTNWKLYSNQNSSAKPDFEEIRNRAR